MNKFNKHGKALPSKKGEPLFSKIFVDSSLKTAGPRLTREQAVFTFDKVQVKTETADDTHQMPIASAQWGDATTKAKPTWLISWYYPVNAFQPWPQKTEICCWWCTHAFEWTPFPLPYQYDLSSNRYRTVGMFCGPSCAKSYAYNVKHYTNMDNVFWWIDIIAEEYFGYSINVEPGVPKRSYIPMAPDKEVLQRYCGPEGMSIDQYRAACCCGRSIKLLPPDWITKKQVVQAENEFARRGGRTVYHHENPDDIQRTQDIVKIHRIPFVGVGAMRITDYIKQKS